MLNPDSLAETVFAVIEALARGEAITAAERERAAVWIAERLGQPGSYRGLAAPTPQDYRGAARLYTGEALNSRASIGHILGQEAARCLVDLNVAHPSVQGAIKRNVEVIEGFEIRDAHRGFYCCGKCSLSLWRHLRVSAIPDAEERITHGLHLLAQARDGKGRWQSFPFYYTLFTLHSLALPEATAELRYALPICERLARRAPRAEDRIAVRRHTLIERVLAEG